MSIGKKRFFSSDLELSPFVCGQYLSWFEGGISMLKDISFFGGSFFKFQWNKTGII